ncbi:MAG TPA: hypothetical protein VGF06_08790 [Terriglobales bacterium]|jgi:hypothetical protein
MKKYAIAVAGLLWFALPVLAQEHYTEGPVWQVSLIRIHPNQTDAYLTSIQEKSKPLLDEEKKQGIILDYKWFFNLTKHDPQDWDMSLAVQYKNFAALDGLVAKGEAVRDKILGSKQAAQQVGEKREEIREVISVMLLREINLK